MNLYRLLKPTLDSYKAPVGSSIKDQKCTIAIIAAETELAAKQIYFAAVDAELSKDQWWRSPTAPKTDPNDAKVELIGTAKEGIASGIVMGRHFT